MYYEINVSRGGRHLFATAERSLTNFNDANDLYNEFSRKFPDCKVSVSKVTKSGQDVTGAMGVMVSV